MDTVKIPPVVRAAVLRRDGHRCIAPQLDGQAGWCRDIFGNIITNWPAKDRGPQYVQMSHVKDEDKPMMGKKAPPDAEHLVTLCPMHHTGTTAGSNWEARNRDRIRRYIEQVNSPVRTYRR